MIQLFGRDVLQNMPVVVDDKEWGMKIDIVDKPWEIDQDQLLDAWLTAMEYLQGAEIFAIPSFNFKDNRTVTYSVNRKWKEFIKK